MRIAGLQKLTLLDFPEHMAATLFCPGCDFRCPFCHNAPLVIPGREGFSGLDLDRVRAFLEKRRGVLDGVCITGGEPLLQPDIADFCAKLKGMGFAVKLDTNGSFPATLEHLIDRGLVDYVAMDVKASFGARGGRGGGQSRDGISDPNPDSEASRFARVLGVDREHAPALMEAVGESAELLMRNLVPYEFRTTVVRELHDEAHLRAIAETIRGARAWYLQGFVDSDGVIGGRGSFHTYTAEEMRRLANAVRPIVPTVELRGVD